MGSDFRAVGGQWGEQEAWQGGLWDEEPELKAEPEKKHIQDWPHTDLRDTEPLADISRLPSPVRHGQNPACVSPLHLLKA